MVCYFKGEAFSGPISFEVQRNDNWSDNIQSFELPFYFISIGNQSYVGLNLLNRLKCKWENKMEKVQMKRSIEWLEELGLSQVRQSIS